MSIKCVIIDDEPLAIRVIESHISKIKPFTVVATYTNPLEAMELLQSVDVI
jgi:DNA-binding NarL/FixJ family response regulator